MAVQVLSLNLKVSPLKIQFKHIQLKYKQPISRRNLNCDATQRFGVEMERELIPRHVRKYSVSHAGIF